MPSIRVDLRKITVLEHQMRERFGDANAFGLPFPAPPGVFGKAGTLVAAVVGADGVISPKEREALAASARTWGATAEEAKLIANVDPKNVSLEALAREVPPGLAGTLLYDGIRIARVDGFHQKEEQAAIRAAKTLGYDATTVYACLGLMGVDDNVMDARRRLLSSPSDLTRHGAGPMIETGAETRGNEYGNTGPMPRDFVARIGKAILVVAAADGDLSETEMTWFLGQAKSVGTPDDVLEEFVKFDAVGQRIENYVDDRLRPFARGIVWDAIRTASADGYHSKERAQLINVSKKLGLDDTFPVALENQMRVEESLRNARLTLLRPRNR